jgi:hypothetical protein
LKNVYSHTEDKRTNNISPKLGLLVILEMFEKITGFYGVVYLTSLLSVSQLS